MAMSETKANTEAEIKVVRPLANFPPCLWGDRFLSSSLDNTKLEAYAKAMEEPKEDLRRLIVSPNMDSNVKLRLISCVYRLGLKYLFADEINGQLDKLFKELNLDDYNEFDLLTISVNFQVFRQCGYRLSCDVFKKFKDCSSGKFKEYITSDVRGLLSFYESTQLRIPGESILDEAFAFTKVQLKSVVDTLEAGNLARQVKHALGNPFHRGIEMVEARLYFTMYEEECSTYDSLPKLANANFNYMQLLHKEELHMVTKWGKEMEFQVITPYARDRIQDIYLWGLGSYCEPHYSEARILTAKIVQLICVLDDTYDAYATIDELQLLTYAIQRWEISAMEQLPEYMKPLYKILLNEHTQLEKQLSKIGRGNMVNVLKQAFQELAKGYLKEADWRHSGHVPSFQEYMKNGIITSTYTTVFAKAFIVSMAEIVTEDALAWFESHPKLLEATGVLGRVYNDVASFQFESQRAQKQVTSIDAYMKTFGVCENVAIDELEKIIENAWKDINEGFLKPTAVSAELLAPILNVARMTDVIYRCKDKLTFPESTIEEYFTLLFVASIPMY